MCYLQNVFTGCEELNLVGEKVTAPCAHHFEAANRLACIKIRSDCFEATGCHSAFEEMQVFMETLQVTNRCGADVKEGVPQRMKSCQS